MENQQTTTANKRPGMIYCERCGEDYSDTYRRCPFCDERPGHRIDEHHYNSRNPLQLAVLVGSLVLVIAAMFIVFTKISPLLMGDEEEPPDPAPDTSQTQPENPATPELPEDTAPVVDDPGPDVVSINAIVLSKQDITLKPGETYPILATVSPADATAPVVWTSSHPDILTVTDGTVVNNNTTGEKVVVTVTATCGGLSAECIVRCSSAGETSTQQPGTSTENPGTSTQVPSTPSTTISGRTPATVVNAGSGLNIRSGPGSDYEKVASASNGSTVTILEDAGNGWYKIDYGSDKVGYASSQFIQPK